MRRMTLPRRITLPSCDLNPITQATSMTPPPVKTIDASDPGSTSSSLMRGVKAADDIAWQRLTDVYGPLVYRWTRQFGIPAADSADLMQEVFQGVAVGIREFRGKREGKRFRGWLRAITRNKVSDYFRRHDGKAKAVGGTDFQMQLAELAETGEASSVSGLDQNDRRLILRQTLNALRAEFQPNTWQAFWQVTVDGQSAADVAMELGMTANGVRQAKFRVLRRLRQQIEEVD